METVYYIATTEAAGTEVWKRDQHILSQAIGAPPDYVWHTSKRRKYQYCTSDSTLCTVVCFLRRSRLKKQQWSE